MEDWIVCTLGGDGASTAEDDWQDVIGRIAPMRRTQSARGKSEGGWERFRLVGRRGITVVSLIDRTLIKEQELSELAGDLLALIESGHHRLVLDFAAVERLSSWAVAAVAEASRKCAAARGGLLKVCGLRPQVISVFGITALDREVKIYVDQNSAIDTPWPEVPELSPLPVDVLFCLTRVATKGYMATLDSLAQGLEVDPDATNMTEDFTAMSGAWISAEGGPMVGRMIAIDGPQFVIGRDSSCHLRLDSPSISRRHAIIERQDDRFLLKDLGSTNGTLLNGLPIHGERVEISDGDRLQLGQLPLRLTIGPAGKHASVEGVEEMVAAWLQDDDRGVAAIEREAPPTEEIVIPEGLDGKVRLKREIIEDVVVITPLSSDLDGETTIGPLRTELLSLFDQPVPRRVVVNLTHVGHLTGRAIGVLLAHHLKLESEGGALRVCQPNPRVASVIEQAKLAMLVECHPSLDDAVLSHWPGIADDASRDAV